MKTSTITPCIIINLLAKYAIVCNSTTRKCTSNAYIMHTFKRRHNHQTPIRMNTPTQSSPNPYAYQPTKNKRNLKWEERYEELKQYKTIHGNANVPQSCRENPELGRWVRRQRVDYASIVDRARTNSGVINNDMLEGCDNITRYRIRKLIDVGFVFDLKNEIWYTRLEELKEFQAIHGHSRVPQHYTKDRRWYKLGLWVRNQRAMYNRIVHLDGDFSTETSSNDGHHSPSANNDALSNGVPYNFLTEERIQLLNEAGFCWDVQEENWLEHFDKLLQFKKEHGVADVPSRYRQDPALSRWVQEQKRKKDSLNPERLERLENIGFVWGNRNDLHWWNNYDAMCEFRREYGTCSVPAYYHDYKLYNWVNNTRRKCKEFCSLVKTKEQLLDAECYSAVSGLDKKRIEALREIDFCWLPSINENGELMIQQPSNKKNQTLRRIPKPKKEIAERQRKSQRIVPVPMKPAPKEEKKFIPFPWDEI